MTRKKLIFDAVDNLVGKLLYYDRKEDEELPTGAIEEAIASREISVEGIITRFTEQLRRGVT